MIFSYSTPLKMYENVKKTASQSHKKTHPVSVSCLDLHHN